MSSLFLFLYIVHLLYFHDLETITSMKKPRESYKVCENDWVTRIERVKSQVKNGGAEGSVV